MRLRIAGHLRLDAAMHRTFPARIVSPAATARGSAYRADIDGLRAVAVAAVVLFHAGIMRLSGGFVGVDIFFVISGFLIGGIVDREIGEGRFSFIAFYARRARRILPPLLVVALATQGAGLLLLGPDELAGLSYSIGAALLGASNLWFWHATGYFSPDARSLPFLMTWSLGIEEQFYLLLPPMLLLLRGLSRYWRIAIVGMVTATSFALGVLLSARYPVESFYLLPTRAWELGAGVLLALVGQRAGFNRMAPAWGREALALAGIVAIAAAILRYNEGMAYPGIAALLPVAGATLVIATPGSLVDRALLGRRPLVAIGLISYSWYLWHWPLMAYIWILSTTRPTVGLMTLVAFAAIIPAWLSWYYVERPARRARGDVASLRQWGGAVAVVAPLCILVGLFGGWPARLGPQGREIAHVLASNPGAACLTSENDDRPITTGPCVIPASKPGMALLGDSHAAALAPALRAQTIGSGRAWVQWTKSACPPLLGAARSQPGHPDETRACMAYNHAAITAIAADPMIDTVVLTAFWEAPFDTRARRLGQVYTDGRADRPGEAVLADALTRTLATLTSAGKQVILLGDVPYLPVNPVGELYAMHLPARSALQTLFSPAWHAHDGLIPRSAVGQATRAPAILAQAARRTPGVFYRPLDEILCSRTACRFALGGVPLYRDPQHLTTHGAAFVMAHGKIG